MDAKKTLIQFGDSPEEVERAMKEVQASGSAKKDGSWIGSLLFAGVKAFMAYQLVKEKEALEKMREQTLRKVKKHGFGSQSSELLFIAQALRGDWLDMFSMWNHKYVPIPVVRWWLCDCVEHIGIAKTDRDIIRFSRNAVMICRLYVCAEVTMALLTKACKGIATYGETDARHKDLDACRRYNRRSLGAMMPNSERMPFLWLQLAAETAKIACLVDPYERLGYVVDLFSFDNKHRIVDLSQDLGWITHRLAYLCEVYATCGERGFWLLWNNECLIEQPKDVEILYQPPPEHWQELIHPDNWRFWARKAPKNPSPSQEELKLT